MFTLVQGIIVVFAKSPSVDNDNIQYSQIKTVAAILHRIVASVMLLKEPGAVCMSIPSMNSSRSSLVLEVFLCQKKWMWSL